MDGLKRIQVNGDVTDVIAEAMEEAGEFEHVLILYEKKREAGGSCGFIHGGDAKKSTLNWMVDQFKQLLLSDRDWDTDKKDGA